MAEAVADFDKGSPGLEAMAGQDARVLILGSLSGAMSLAADQYYAQPRNAFWPIMAELVGAAPALPYFERIRLLVGARIALWDVCARASRAGSLDSAIHVGSVVPNDIDGFLRSHAGVRLVCFNGTKAAELFRRHVLPALGPSERAVRRVTLPSTSSAHAVATFEQKLEAWRTALAEAEVQVDR